MVPIWSPSIEMPANVQAASPGPEDWWKPAQLLGAGNWKNCTTSVAVRVPPRPSGKMAFQTVAGVAGGSASCISNHMLKSVPRFTPLLIPAVLMGTTICTAKLLPVTQTRVLLFSQGGLVRPKLVKLVGTPAALTE